MSGIEVVLLVWMGVLTCVVAFGGHTLSLRLGALEGKRRKPRAPKPPVSP